MKIKVLSISMISLMAVSAIGVIFLATSNEKINEAEAYSTRSVPTTIDLNATSDETIREYYDNLSSLGNNEKTGTNLLKNLKPILKNGQQYFS
jgi:hypothetical protein